MNFKTFVEQSNDFLIEMANPKKGLIEREIKVKFLPDQSDRDLFMTFSASFSDPARNAAAVQFLSRNGLTPSVPLAARVVRARIALAAATGAGSSEHLQQDAISHKTYFINPRGDNATLIVQGKEIPLDIGFTALKHRLEHYPIGDGKTGNIKKDLPRFTHPSVQGKIAPRDESGKPKGQTNGINKATLGISGSPSEVGWSLAYHKTGVATKALTADEKEYSAKPSAVDSAKEMPDDEKTRIKTLTSSGNNFIDNVLFATKEMKTDLVDSAGDNMTNHEVLNLAKKIIKSRIRGQGNLDHDDILSAFAMLLRNKYGDVNKYESAEKLINSLVGNAIHDVKEDMGIGRKAGEDLAHGKKYGIKAGTIEAGEDSAGITKASPHTDADIKRRTDMIQPEYKPKAGEEAPERENIPVAQNYGVRTYKKDYKSPEKAAAEKAEDDVDTLRTSKELMQDPIQIKQKSNITRSAEPESAEASSQDMEKRRQEFLQKVRGMSAGQPANKPSGALDRLRQKFKLAK